METICEFCGKEDDVEHTLWHCSLTADLRSGLDKEFKWYMDGCECPETKVNGWFEQPSRTNTPWELEVTVYDKGVRQEGQATWDWDKNQPIYFDGSCFNQKVKGYEVAGDAALQIDNEG